VISLAQFVVERVLNSLPEGLLIALGAWLLLRLMGRENSGTRFAVWLVALAAVVVLPFLSGLGLPEHGLPALAPHAHPAIAIQAFWASAFFLLWIAIALAAVARVAVGVWQVRQIRRSCAEIPAAFIDAELQTLLAETRRPVRLLTSEKARVPAALGFRNPAIVLPAWTLRDLSAAELRPILIHELAHLRRHDDWTNLAQKLVRAVLFFHPAVWWIDARLSMEREMACDDAVLAATGNPRAYAGCLIDLLEKSCARRGWSMAQAAVARARDASVRIARILSVGSVATTRVGRTALGVAASLALACAGIALCTPQMVEFVPMQPISATQVTRPFIDNNIGPAPSAVVPASFHPAQKPALMRHAVMKHRSTSHAAPIRQVALEQRPPQDPLVMARIATFESDDQAAAPAPMLIFFETTDEESTATQLAQLRSAAVERSRTNIQQLQSREDPALQIQILQVIDPETGAPVQILRIVFVVPQQVGSPSQSI
jgi:beta-lactamase regulating signal transducer with metallopeptidase domain